MSNIAWALNPFKRAYREIAKHAGILVLSQEGVWVLENRYENSRKIKENMKDLWKEMKKKHRIKLGTEKLLSKLARNEIKQGFLSFIYSATLVLWSTLESSIKLFLLECIKNKQEAFSNDIKVTLCLFEYERKSVDERRHYIINQLEEKSRTKTGINQFENLLELVGLDGEIPKKISDKIYEMQQIRNLIMHRMGIIDHYFIEKCNWANNLRVGLQYKMSSSDYIKMLDAVTSYIGIIMDRINIKWSAGSTKLLIPIDASAK